MTTTAAVLIEAKFAEDAQTTQYTSDNLKTIIDKFTVTNITAGTVNIAVYLVEDGDTASTNNIILTSKPIQPNETYTCPELVGQILEAGDFISTIAGTANALVIRGSGRKIS